MDCWLTTSDPPSIRRSPTWSAASVASLVDASSLTRRARPVWDATHVRDNEWMNEQRRNTPSQVVVTEREHPIVHVARYWAISLENSPESSWDKVAARPHSTGTEWSPTTSQFRYKRAFKKTRFRVRRLRSYNLTATKRRLDWVSSGQLAS
jgi:hypothetical protein